MAKTVSTHISSLAFNALFKSGNIQSIAYYIALKKAHPSNARLNYQDMCKLIGCSENSLRYHIGILDSLGLLTKTKVGKAVYIAFKSNHSLAGKKKKWAVRVNERNETVWYKTIRKQFLKFNETTVNELKKEIDSLLITANLSRQSITIDHLQSNDRSSDYTGMSCKSIAKLKGLKSAATGKRLVDRAIELKKITKTHIFEKLDIQGVTPYNFHYLKTDGIIPANAFLTQANTVILRKHNKYELVNDTNKYKNKKPVQAKASLPNTVITATKENTVAVTITPIKKVAEKTSKVEIKTNAAFIQTVVVPYVFKRPSGYFTKGYLTKLGFTYKEIKELFVLELVSTQTADGEVCSRNIYLMSFKTFNNKLREKTIAHQMNR